MAGLHQIALENISTYKSDSQKCFAVKAVCGDATDFPFPNDPLVLYLFNPLPASGLKRVIASLQNSLNSHPRAVYVLYHNPLLEVVLSETTALTKVSGTYQYSLYADKKTAAQK